MREIKMKTTQQDLQIVHVADINVDYETDGGYQRKEDIKRIEKYAKAFDWKLFDLPLIGIREDGTYWVIDGNNRIKLLQKIGVEKVMCRIARQTNRDSERKLFLARNKSGINRGKTVSPYIVYKNAILAGEPAEVKLNEIFNKYGLTVTTGKTTLNNHIGDIGTYVDKMKSSAKLTEKAIDFIKTTWPNSNEAWSASFLNGVMEYLSNLTEEEVRKSYRKLSKCEPKYIVQAAKLLAKNDDGHVRYYIKEVFSTETKIAHNYGKSNNKGK